MLKINKEKNKKSLRNIHDKNWHLNEKLSDKAIPFCLNRILFFGMNVSDTNQWKWSKSNKAKLTTLVKRDLQYPASSQALEWILSFQYHRYSKSKEVCKRGKWKYSISSHAWKSHTDFNSGTYVKQGNRDYRVLHKSNREK